MALVLAKFFGEKPARRLGNNDMLMAGVLTGVPLLLIARQPDLGTAVTLLPILLAIAFVAGMPVRLLGVARARRRAGGAGRVDSSR